MEFSQKELKSSNVVVSKAGVDVLRVNHVKHVKYYYIASSYTKHKSNNIVLSLYISSIKKKESFSLLASGDRKGFLAIIAMLHIFYLLKRGKWVGRFKKQYILT